MEWGDEHPVKLRIGVRCSGLAAITQLNTHTTGWSVLSVVMPL